MAEDGKHGHRLAKRKVTSWLNASMSALETFAPGTKIRSDWGDGDYDKENQFTILSKTLCPAVLTENFFHGQQRMMWIIFFQMKVKKP